MFTLGVILFLLIACACLGVMFFLSTYDGIEGLCIAVVSVFLFFNLQGTVKDYKQLQQESLVASQRYTTLNEQYQATLVDVKELRASIESSDAKLQQTYARLETAKGNLEAAKATNAQLKATYATATAGLVEEIKDLRETSNEINAKLIASLNENRDLEESNEDLKAVIWEVQKAVGGFHE